MSIERNLISLSFLDTGFSLIRQSNLFGPTETLAKDI